MAISREKRVVIVGAGIGGLAAACDLSARGFAVTVLERHAHVGGKMRTTPSHMGPVDSGPTVLTMRWVFDTLFAACGGDFASAVQTERANVLARHAWDSNESFDLYADEASTIDAIANFAGARDADGYRRFCHYARTIYARVFAPFMQSAKPNFGTLLRHYGPKLLGALRDIDAFRSMAAAQQTFFEDRRLRQLFGRYATYAGGAPHLSPATLNVIAHVEQDGVWFVTGGMQSLANALANLARDNGATIRCNAGVQQIVSKQSAVVGVKLDSGELLETNAVVFNGEPEAAEALAQPKARSKRAQGPTALSAITWTGAASAKGFALARHNVFFAPDPLQEFEQIFKHGRLPSEAPTVYICAQDRTNEAPPGCSDGATEVHGKQALGNPERIDTSNAGIGTSNTSDGKAIDATRNVGSSERLLVLVNAPANATPPSPTEIAACQDTVNRHLARCGLTLTWTAPPTCTTPETFAQLFPHSHGALYGKPPHGWRSFFNRRGSRMPLRGLYLAGGSVHPGPGVPMAALSGRLAAAALAEDFPLTTPSRTTVTHGGISTPKATTAATP